MRFSLGKFAGVARDEPVRDAEGLQVPGVRGEELTAPQRFYLVILPGLNVVRVQIADGRPVAWKPADVSDDLKRAALEQVGKIEPLAAEATAK